MSGIKVMKSLRSGPWAVTCDCAGLFDLPWTYAGNWQTAMVLARWHASLHAEQRCPTCLHEPPLPKPKVLEGDRSMFTYDGRLYRLTSLGVVAMVEADQ